MNRQVFPSSLFPLRGDISAEAGAVSVIVQGIQGIPVVAPPTEPTDLNTFFYNAYGNFWYYASPWDIPASQELTFEGGYGYNSVGLSWLANDTLAIGDGTPGDVSGAMAMTALILFGGPSYDYYYESAYTTIYSGATFPWSLILPTDPGIAGQTLHTDGTGRTYWA